MLRKICAFPFSFLAKAFGLVFVVLGFVSSMIKGKSLDDMNKQLDKLINGLEASIGDSDAIIEIVESKYGSGKAMQVSEILNRD